MIVSIISAILIGIAIFIFLTKAIDWIKQKQQEMSKAKKPNLANRFLKLSPKHQMIVIMSIAFLIVFIVSQKIVFAIIASAAVAYFKWSSQKKKEKKLAALIDSQVIESLTTIKAAILAGQSLQNAIVVTTNDLKEPIKSDFERISNELIMGMDFDTVLIEASKKARSKEFRFMIDTINLSKDTGASLSGIFDRIIESTTQRIVLQGKVTALTSQGKLSGTVVSFIPFVVLALMYLMQPDMVKVLFNTLIGNILLLLVVVMVVVGSFVIRKISEVEL
jgi:tight adherence protein B